MHRPQTPGLDALGGGFAAVDARSRSDAWAVGSYYDKAGVYQLIEHWDGTRWTRSRARGPGATLTGVSAVSPSDAWTVGYYNRSSYPRPSGISEHFDGLGWRRLGSGGQHLSGVSATSSTDAWVVGWTEYEGQIDGYLILHWDGTRWR